MIDDAAGKGTLLCFWRFPFGTGISKLKLPRTSPHPDGGSHNTLRLDSPNEVASCADKSVRGQVLAKPRHLH